MSAFVVSQKHIEYLVGAAWRYGSIDRGAPDVVEYTAAMLDRENRVSVAHRYPTAEILPGAAEVAAQWAEVARTTFDVVAVSRRIDPVTLLKQLACYEYQSCEHPQWEASKAHALCQRIRGAAIASLPGYDVAPWGL